MPRYERGDIVKVEGLSGHWVVESYLEPSNGPISVQIWHDKILVACLDLDKVNLIRESSFENHYLRGKNKGPK